MNTILASYRSLLEEIDSWFTDNNRRYANDITCRQSCSGCCRGLFEISLLDAALLQQGFAQLDEHQQRKSLSKATKRVYQLQQQWPEFKAPYILNHLPHEDWQQMPEADETPCPLLGDDGLCMTYAWRPMTCRLHGLPNIDVSGEMFSDSWCSLNFTGRSPLSLDGLPWRFRQTFASEFDLLGQLSEELSGCRQLELDTFIPTALLIDFNGTDWQKLLCRETA